MSRFARILQSTAERLDIPQPSKANVLLELAADLEDLFLYYKNQGHDDATAMRMAEERLHANDDVLRQLARVHASAFQRWVERFSDRTRSAGERILLLVVVLFSLIFFGAQLSGTPLLRDAGPYIWPVAAIAAAGFALALAKLYQLYVKKDHHVRRLRNGLPELLFLALAGSFVGLFGVVHGLWAATFGAAMERGDPAILFHRWLFESVATLIVGLLVTIAASLAWFLILNKVLRIERAEASQLVE